MATLPTLDETKPYYGPCRCHLPLQITWQTCGPCKCFESSKLSAQTSLESVLSHASTEAPQDGNDDSFSDDGSLSEQDSSEVLLDDPLLDETLQRRYREEALLEYDDADVDGTERWSFQEHHHALIEQRKCDKVKSFFRRVFA